MSNLGNKEIMAKNIRRFIERTGKTYTAVSDDLGVKYTTFLDWVNAKSYPRIDKIEIMANYFGIKKSDLVEDPDTQSQDIDSFEFALSTEAKDMTDEMKQSVLDFIRFIKEQEKKEK